MKLEAPGGPPFPGGEDAPERLLGEEPLAIRVQGDPYAVMMRTPGEEISHAAGFALAEGIVRRPGDIERIDHRAGNGSNVVSLTLTAGRHAQIADLLRRRRRVCRTGSAAGGKEWIRDLLQGVGPLDDVATFPAPAMAECVRTLCDHQALRSATRASHGVALYDAERRLLALAEDVGRHNAVDKAVGQLFLRGELSRALVLLVSSRISYELVEKAARARVPIILALSHPTASAVEVGVKLNMTLVTIREHARASVYCGGHRIRAA